MAASALTVVGVGHADYTTAQSSAATSGVAVGSGDFLIAVGATALRGTTTMSSVSGGGLTWTALTQTTNDSYPHLRAWTATASSTGSLAATFTASNGTSQIGGTLVALRNNGAVEAYNTATAAASNNSTQTWGISSANIHDWVFYMGAAQPGAGGGSRAWLANFGTVTETLFSSTAAWNVAQSYHGDVPEVGAASIGVNDMVSGAPGTSSVLIQVRGNPSAGGGPVGYGKAQQGAGA